MTPPQQDNRTIGRAAGKEVGNGQNGGATTTDDRHSRMTVITVKLTTEELDLLTALASDQLFRRQYIDPRLPGYKSNPAEVKAGKELVERLRQMGDRAKGTQSPKRNGATA